MGSMKQRGRDEKDMLRHRPTPDKTMDADQAVWCWKPDPGF